MKARDQWGRRSDLPGILEVYRRPPGRFMRRSRTAPLAEEYPEALPSSGPTGAVYRVRRPARLRAVLGCVGWVIFCFAVGATLRFIILPALFGRDETLPCGAETPGGAPAPPAACLSAPRTVSQAETPGAAQAGGNALRSPDFWKAICAWESGGDPLARRPEEDAAGIAQIRPCVLEDCRRLNLGDWTPDERYDPAASRAIGLAYLGYWGRRYEERTGRPATAEVYARIWNGGPQGWRRASTRRYWLEVRKKMTEG